MGFGETLVAIVLILALAVRSMVKMDHRHDQRLAAGQPAIDEADYHALKERVAVLEALAVDDGARLDREIDRLRDRSARLEDRHVR